MIPLRGFTRLELPAELASLAKVDAHFRSLLSAAGVATVVSEDIVLSVNEAMNNAVDHGSRYQRDLTITVDYRLDTDRFVLLLTDPGGRTFDPGYFRELAIRKDWAIGGRGILIMHELMDELLFFFIPGRSTTVMLAKALG
ncbi:MAG: ATP-binding protein [Candidatus Wallbacteria bacterium]|nr:ATP-binding protein [Candidatus Wallbacteria bacterium]